MQVDNLYLFSAILVIAVVTFGTRIAPFLLFGKGKATATPSYIVYLGNFLPPAVIAMLIVYCLKNVDFLASPHGLPEIAGILVVTLLHLWKRNNLLSILGGTIVYMVIVQTLVK